MTRLSERVGIDGEAPDRERTLVFAIERKPGQTFRPTKSFRPSSVEDQHAAVTEHQRLRILLPIAGRVGDRDPHHVGHGIPVDARESVKPGVFVIRDTDRNPARGQFARTRWTPALRFHVESPRAGARVNDIQPTASRSR